MLQWGGSAVYKPREVVTVSRVPPQAEMGAVTNLLVLLCAVSCVTAWERLPNIPANRRAEYYLLHNDGGYKYGYDTGSGASHSAMADANNEVRGSYAYQSPEGPVTLVYTAGRGGFVPDTGSAAQVVSAVRSQTSQAAYSTAVRAPAVTSQAAYSTAVRAPAVTSQAVTRTEQHSDYDENADASYNFNFDTDEYKRQEASDAKGNIRGRYTYNTKEGNRVAVDYKAGAGTGFVIEKQEGLDAPASSSAHSQYSAPSPNIPAPKPYSGPLANTVASGPLQDGSYSFSYQSSDHDRQESGDASGLVRGRYSFVADDGVRRTVDYHAGAQSGYVPSGDGIAPVPAVPAVQAYTARPAIVAPKIGYQYQAPASQEDETPGDASYSFAYEADDHARKESSDPSGNVEGEYSYTAPDGQNRKIKYTAGAEKGFVVQEESAAVSNYAAKSAAPKPAPYVPQPAPYVPQPAPYVPQPAVYSAPASQSAFAAQHAAMTKNVVESLGNTDASYSFSYQTNDHAHNANADKTGNVRGSYSFVADDGVNRQVDYEAGSATGFIARGAHLPVAPVVPVQNTYTAAQQTYSSKPAQAYVPQIKSYVPPAPAYIAPVVKSSAVPTDGSYSFSYNAGDSARQENADASGYVRGQYSFTADDGVSRSVQYEAGANKGFIAQGSHLPSAPEHASAVSISRASVTPQASVSSYNAANEEKGHSAYSYNYQTDTSSKSESSDAQGNVVGSFTFVGGDGQARTLNYVAGPESGFQASGAHLPVAPVVQANSATQSFATPVIRTSPVIAAKSTIGTAHGSAGGWTKAASWTAPAANFVLHKYLPPESAQKYGYVFDTQA